MKTDQIKILVVDDDPVARTILVTSLRQSGFSRVWEADDTPSALHLLPQQEFDVIVTDVEMFPINGLELVRGIRCGETRAPRDLPIIVLTGHSEESVVGTALLLDANAFLIKPVKRHILLEKLERVLSRRDPVKPPVAYKALDTSEAGLIARFMQAEQPAMDALDSGKAYRVEHIDHVIKAISELQEGDVLMEPVYLNNILLLRKNIILKQSNIDQLLDLQEMLSVKSISIIPHDRIE